MSNWTHVAAILRVDSLRLSSNEEMNFQEIFGRELSFYSADEVFDEAQSHPERFLPCGSEGSLQMSVWENPNRSCLAAYTVSIFGDLRDHDSVDEIIAWFDEKCRNLEALAFIIRQAVITVDNERHGTKTKTYEFIDS